MAFKLLKSAHIQIFFNFPPNNFPIHSPMFNFLEVQNIRKSRFFFKKKINYLKNRIFIQKYQNFKNKLKFSNVDFYKNYKICKNYKLRYGKLQQFTYGTMPYNTSLFCSVSIRNLKVIYDLMWQFASQTITKWKVIYNEYQRLINPKKKYLKIL